MTQARTRAAILLVLPLLGACAERLQEIGRAPAMTAPGAQREVIAPIAPQRAALAQSYAAIPPEHAAIASTWRSGPTSLFGDRRARTIGDILTVVIEIDDSADITNESERERTADEQAGIQALLGLPSVADVILPSDATLDPAVELGTSSSSSGKGSTNRAEEIELRVAATVIDVLPNGHFVIQGSQEVRVNFELRDLQVAGVIRPEDITRRNEITYDKIADARIAYGGRGQITDVQQPRYGQQLLDIVMPF